MTAIVRIAVYGEPADACSCAIFLGEAPDLVDDWRVYQIRRRGRFLIVGSVFELIIGPTLSSLG